MANDIVFKLRNADRYEDEFILIEDVVVDEAADEIDRLRKEVEKLNRAFDDAIAAGLIEVEKRVAAERERDAAQARAVAVCQRFIFTGTVGQVK